MTQLHTRRLNLTADSGQTLAEYSFLVALIAIVVAVLLPGIATTLTGIFNGFTAAIAG
jgi:Flp pilus assembly pilin Flp